MSVLSRVPAPNRLGDSIAKHIQRCVLRSSFLFFVFCSRCALCLVFDDNSTAGNKNRFDDNGIVVPSFSINSAIVYSPLVNIDTKLFYPRYHLLTVLVFRIAKARQPAKPICRPSRQLRSSAPAIQGVQAPQATPGLKSAFKTPGTPRPQKRVTFQHQSRTISEVRLYEADLSQAGPPALDTNGPHRRGRSSITKASSDGRMYHIRYDGVFNEPPFIGTLGPDGHYGRCPYCANNQAAGHFIPAYHSSIGVSLQSISKGEIFASWMNSCRGLKCEDHAGEP